MIFFLDQVLYMVGIDLDMEHHSYNIDPTLVRLMQGHCSSSAYLLICNQNPPIHMGFFFPNNN